MTTYLHVPFAAKAEAKAKGARWDSEAPKWFVPIGRDLELFSSWLPVDPAKLAAQDLVEAAKGVPLSHYRKGPANTVEYADRTERWSGPGKNEFQENVAKAFAERSPVRLIVVRTLHPERVQAGESGHKIPKDFDAKTEQIGEVVDFDGNNYVFRFRRRADEGTTK